MTSAMFANATSILRKITYFYCNWVKQDFSSRHKPVSRPKNGSRTSMKRSAHWQSPNKRDKNRHSGAVPVAWSSATNKKIQAPWTPSKDRNNRVRNIHLPAHRKWSEKNRKRVNRHPNGRPKYRKRKLFLRIIAWNAPKDFFSDFLYLIDLIDINIK